MRTTYISIALAGKRQHPKLKLVKPILQNLFSAIEDANKQKSNSLKIRLLTGLADGVDLDGAEALLQWKPKFDTIKTLVAVIPFNKADYLKTIENKERFAYIFEACSSLIVLDGKYATDTNRTEVGLLPAEQRSRAYRQQADYLIESSDFLLAIADPTETGNAGGTLETVEKALGKRLPVIMLSLFDMNLYFLNQKNALQNLIAGKHMQLNENSDELEAFIAYLMTFYSDL